MSHIDNGRGAVSNLEKALGERLRALGWTLAVAESCTGGGLGQRLTRVPGSSDYFVGGVIAYSNSLKASLLGVAEAMLATDGAVSESCATEMAEGVRRVCSSDSGLSVTGIAGPGGETPGKPVGLVFIGFSVRDGTVVREYRFSGSRDEIRGDATDAALELAIEQLQRLA